MTEDQMSVAEIQKASNEICQIAKCVKSLIGRRVRIAESCFRAGEVGKIQASHISKDGLMFAVELDSGEYAYCTRAMFEFLEAAEKNDTPAADTDDAKRKTCRELASLGKRLNNISNEIAAVKLTLSELIAWLAGPDGSKWPNC